MGNQELDMEIAEKVMKWERGRHWGNGNGGWIIDGKPYEEHHTSWQQTPRFSTKMEAAMQVVEKMREGGRSFSAAYCAWTDDNWWWSVEFGWDDASGFTQEGEYCSASLPEAICKAALKTLRTNTLASSGTA